MPNIRVNDCDIHYELHGAGPELVYRLALTETSDGYELDVEANEATSTATNGSASSR